MNMQHIGTNTLKQEGNWEQISHYLKVGTAVSGGQMSLLEIPQMSERKNPSTSS